MPHSLRSTQCHMRVFGDLHEQAALHAECVAPTAQAAVASLLELARVGDSVLKNEHRDIVTV